MSGTASRLVRERFHRDYAERDLDALTEATKGRN